MLIDFRERGEEEEIEEEKHQSVASPMCNLGMCPDQEFNLQPFGL